MCTSICTGANTKPSVLTFQLCPLFLGFTFQLSNVVGPNFPLSGPSFPTFQLFGGLTLECWKVKPKKLESWKVGNLESWKVGRLEYWNAGKLESKEVRKLPKVGPKKLES